MASLWLGPPREGLLPWVFHKEHVHTAKMKKEKVSHLLSLSDQLNKCGRGKESHLHARFPSMWSVRDLSPHKKALWDDDFRAPYGLHSDPYVFTCFSIIFFSSLSLKSSL